MDLSEGRISKRGEGKGELFLFAMKGICKSCFVLLNAK